jgi:RimJ/RimL family protein N-acetyltransferase
MPDARNELGQPVGSAVVNWAARARPPREPIEGRFCRIEMLDPARHASDLFEGKQLDRAGHNWTYLPYGPFATLADYRAWLDGVAAADDPLFHTIIDIASGKAVGIASLMRIDPANGVIEVGHIHYSPLLQRRPHATEAMYLLMARVFDELGYRRYEWKCNSLNQPSVDAAKRYGFTYEGLFRQAAVVKGANRDTSWFSIIDHEWPATKQGYQAWLAPANFDADGHQQASLATCIAAARSERT